MPLLSIATTETMANATWGAGGFSYPIGCILLLRERRQELKAGPQRQDRSSNMGPALIINQENVPQTCLQVIFSFEVPSLLNNSSLREKTKQNLNHT